MHPEREEKSMIRKMRRLKQQLSDEAAVEHMTGKASMELKS